MECSGRCEIIVNNRIDLKCNILYDICISHRRDGLYFDEILDQASGGGI